MIMTTTEIKCVIEPKSYHINFDYDKLLTVHQTFLADQFCEIDMPKKLQPLVLYEHVVNKDGSISDLRNQIDQTNTFAEYLSYGLDVLDGRFDTFGEFYMLFAGKHSNVASLREGISNHLHFKRPTREFCRTVTALIPIDIVEPITEHLSFQWTDVPFPQLETKTWEKVSNKEIRREYSKAFLKSLRAAKGNPVEQVFLPNQNELLIIDFNSYNYIHSVDNFTNNSFLIYIFDDCQ